MCGVVDLFIDSCFFSYVPEYYLYSTQRLPIPRPPLLKLFPVILSDVTLYWKQVLELNTVPIVRTVVLRKVRLLPNVVHLSRYR